MNYQRIYEQLTAKDMIADYTEKHHIIPKCMGGTNDPGNIVRLTPEAHYLAHQLLMKIYPDNDKIVFATNRMVSGKYRNNKLYGWIRRKHAEAISKLNSGRVWSDERRARIIGVHKGRTSPRKGCVTSAETKAKISAKSTGRKHTDESKAKISAANKGKHYHRKGSVTSAETKAKISATKKSYPRVICQYCKKEGNASAMRRFHFENCKLNPLYPNI